jgi:hypothetical protein
MSKNWDMGQAQPPSEEPGRLPVLFLTVLVYSVLGTFIYSVFNNLGFYWRVCGVSVPGIGTFDLAQLTVETSTNAAIGNFRHDIWNPSFHAAGLVSCFTGLRYGLPSYLLTTLTWLLVYLLSVLAAYFLTEVGLKVVIGMWPNALYGSMIAVLCCIFVRLFW